MRLLNTYIDHTALKPTTTRSAIEKLCAEAKQYQFASVCVNPCYVPLCSQLLAGSGVAVCTVIGFPLGANTTDIKVAEAKKAIEDGADELDMVINSAALIDGNNDYVRKEIKAIVGCADGRVVKVIIETGLLNDEQKVRAAKLCCEAGATFVKTCTGMTQGAATVEDVKLIRQNITGNVKIKASGGIRTKADAIALIEAGADRIGASAGIAIVEG
ncbi:MAG TPA: deoxyribose-phosphate aldolase [Oscillospiraceae bacterium]|nr:deoxyribose-phosphate aldolase [Oscillospiraceae bacterium]HPS34494.1 deoxyribose-phosphate aldolase [Oscillospiraceae bacterium]